MRDLEVLHCSNHALCVVKPACVPTVPDDSGDTSLVDLGKGWIAREFEKPGAVFLGVVHRLDRPVSGVLVFGRTSKGAARLTRAFHDRVAKKTYVAVTSAPPGGEGAAATGEVQHWLVKRGSKNVVRIVPEGTEGARLAVTRYRVLAKDGPRRLVQLEPVTGRPHQLRVAMASLGAPLLGDLKYGADAPLPDRSLALHALSLEVPHPTADEPIRASTPAPDGRDLPWRAFDGALGGLLDRFRTGG